MTSAPAPRAGALPVATGRETALELWQASRNHRVKLLAVLCLGLLSAALGLLTPVALGRLVDVVQSGNADLGTVAGVTTVIAAAASASAIGAAVTIVFAARVYQIMLADLREQLVARSLALPQSVIERAGTGDLIARASDDVAEVADAAPEVIPALTGAFFTIVVTFAGMSTLDWRYALALVILLPVYVVTLRWYMRTAPGIYAAERTAMSERAQNILESVRGADTVRAFGLSERHHAQITRTSWDVVRQALRARTVQNMFFGRLNFAEFLGMSGILISGYLLINAGLSTVGAATTAMLFFLRLFNPINELLFVVDVLQSALASLNRIVGVIRAPIPGAFASAGATSEPHTGATGSVDLRNLSFSYDGGHQVLHDIDLTVAAGARVAVVGASGAGKTTLAAVIAGVHPADGGTLTRPGDVVLIAQHAHVFTGTLRENLTLAAPEASDADLLDALHRTAASGLLDLLPDGLDTLCGADGHDLTPAQAQQIALARVILADPQLAIFDEATAEAGSAHADSLDRAADAALQGRTGLVIAHRLSQAASCDRIVVMESGRITEVGTHTELLDAGGGYADLWQAWSSTRTSPGVT